jgi:transcriptional regulator with XRE-family HTH domain
MEPKTLDLINAMEAERTRRKLSHQDFSTLLGITDSYWCMIRKGKRRISLNLIGAIHEQLPEVSKYADAYTRPEIGG